MECGEKFNGIKKENKKGFTKENLRKLVFAKPTAQDWLMLIMMILCLLLAYSYQNETKQANYIVDNLGEICMNYTMLQNNINAQKDISLDINFSQEEFFEASKFKGA